MMPDLRFVIGAAFATALLVVASVGLFTTVKLGPQSKAGPLQTSRTLGFDDRAGWNQFYDPEALRRFEELVGYAALVAKGSADEAAGVAQPVEPAGGAPDPAPPKQSADPSPLATEDLAVRHIGDAPAEVTQPSAVAEVPSEHAPDQQGAAVQPEASAADVEPRAADQATSAAPPAAELSAEIGTASPDSGDETTAAIGPAPATGVTPLWRDEPLFVVEDTPESASAEDHPAPTTAEAAAFDSAEQPPTASPPAAKRTAPRVRKLARPLKTTARAAAVRVRSKPSRRRLVASPRRSAPRSQFTLHPQFSRESYSWQDYAPRGSASQGTARRQHNHDPFGRTFAPP